MIKIIGFLVCVLMVVSPLLAQFGKRDRCPEVKAVDNFDPKKFSGTWYVTSRNKNTLYESGQKCSQWTYIESGSGINKLKFNAVLITSGAKVDWEGKATPIGGPSAANFDIEFPEYSLRRESNFTILTTDYDHYAVQFACQNYGDASLHYVWILSRTPMQDPQYGKVVDQFVQQNVDIPMSEMVNIDQQNCPR